MTRRCRSIGIVLGLAAVGWFFLGGDQTEARQATPATQTDERDGGQALVDLLFIGAGLLILAGGGVGLYAAWHARGRDPHTGLVADFLPQPPDDLPPGAAGTLLDERADHCDVVATLADLGHREVIRVTDTGATSPSGTGRRDFLLELVRPDNPVAPFERELLRATFGSKPAVGATTRLSRIKPEFDAAQPAIKEQLYAELCARGYFPRSPEATRRRGRNLGLSLLAVCAVAGVAAALLVSPFAWFTTAAAVGLALVVVRLSGSMPRKSAAGAEAAARWHAFRRYLASIEKYEKVSEATGIFDRYLPYAVAFGLDRAWVATFAAAGATAPAWYGAGDWLPSDLIGLSLPSGDWNLGAVSNLGTPDLPDLDVQGASEFVGTSLQVASDGLGAMLDAAGSVFEGFDLNW